MGFISLDHFESKILVDKGSFRQSCKFAQIKLKINNIFNFMQLSIIQLHQL